MLSYDLRAGMRVSAVSIAWTLTSSVAAVTIGIAAGSLVLVAFGLTGVLDAAGSATLVVHFRLALRSDTFSESHERRDGLSAGRCHSRGDRARVCVRVVVGRSHGGHGCGLRSGWHCRGDDAGVTSRPYASGTNHRCPVATPPPKALTPAPVETPAKT